MLRKYFSRMVVCVLLVCAVACSGSWTALASPEAVAVWNGDFSPNVHTNGNGYALSDVATYTTYTGYGDDEYKSVTIKGDDIGLLCNFPNKMSQFTILVKYSGLETSDSYTRTIFATTARADYNLDKCGIRMLTNGTVIGLLNDSPDFDNDKDFGTPSDASVPASGIFAVTYDLMDTMSFYAASDDKPLVEIWSDEGLVIGCMCGFAVGGHCIGSRNLSAKSVQAAKGMTITGLAVFTNVLTVAEMSEYLWPTNTSTIDAGNETTDEPEVPDDPQEPDAPQDPDDPQEPDAPQDPDEPQEPLEPEDAERAPVAVWDGDFSQSARTKFTGFTLVDDQQTHGENSSSVTIDRDNQGLLVDFKEKHGSFTVLVKYSNLVANDLSHRVVFATTANDTNQYDRVGVRLTGDGKLIGFENESLDSGDYDMPYTNDMTGTQKFYTNGTLAVIYDMSDKGGLYVYAASTDGVFPAEEAWGAPGITRGCMTGFSVGGMCRGAGNMQDVEAAKGMTITGLAVFTNALTVAEMNAYKWPEPPAYTDTEFPAPYLWIDRYFPDLVSGWSSAQYNDFATNKNHSSVKNGYAPWESYVLGLEPTNETSKFTVSIRMDGTTPVVEYSPTNEVLKASGDIKYVLQGKPTLNNDWQDVDFNEPGDTNRFFRVKVIW